MIINSITYGITQPLRTNWNINFTSRQLTSGFYRRWDYGIATDLVSCVVTVKGLYDDIKTLQSYLKDNRESESILFEDQEDVFGCHVDYSSAFNCLISNVSAFSRLDDTYWTISFTASTTSPPILDAIIPTLDYLYYDNSYLAGDEYLNENSNLETYGDLNNSFRDTIQKNVLKFSLEKGQAQRFIKYIVTLSRGDLFPLPTKWQDLKPFGEATYTHALMNEFSFSKENNKNYTIDIEIQGYNDGI